MHEEIARRLQSLERSGRRWRLAFTFVVILLGVMLWLGAKAPDSQSMTVRAHRVIADEFVLHDSAGRVRATLTSGVSGPVLNFYDDDGHVTRSVAPGGFTPAQAK